MFLHLALQRTAFFEYEIIPSGTWKYPTLTHMTHGQRDDSRVFHSKEDNGLYFEYRVADITKTKVVLESIYASKSQTNKKCLARFEIKPKNPNHIIRVKTV